ncbi:GFA family protein [Devosia sp. A8/3-2]|nr:GFA family protein [Devosia sp. A8/3-2]
MSLPEFPVEGGCVCGAVRYRLKASPLAVYNCHCKDCQRSTGGAFQVTMPVKRGDIELIAGTLAAYIVTADSGRQIAQMSCPTCHTRIWNEPQAAPELIMVRAGTLDDMSWAVPVGNVWADRKQPRVTIDPAPVNFAGRRPAANPFTRPRSALTAEGL